MTLFQVLYFHFTNQNPLVDFRVEFFSLACTGVPVLFSFSKLILRHHNTVMGVKKKELLYLFLRLPISVKMNSSMLVFFSLGFGQPFRHRR
jgi:hypothetical protein